MTTQILINAVVPAFNNGSAAARTVESLLHQRLPSGTQLDVVVVDDGSAEPLGDDLEARFGKSCRVIRHSQNRGRAAARNSGAQVGKGEYLLFLDSDCRTHSTGLVAAYMSHLTEATALAFGGVLIVGDDFWTRYQRQVEDRRALALSANDFMTQSSRNFMIRRRMFENVGGFDEQYRDYGFEDRDLFLRLERHGALAAYAPDAVVTHDDRLDLRSVCLKMETAGKSTSAVFRRDNPSDYKRLPYSRFDVREYRLARAAAYVLVPLLPALISFCEPRLESRWIPYSVRRLAVQCLSALSFLKGTYRASGDVR
jgi:GT2 family glycosyltransferase